MSQLIVLIGLQGAGKSTWCRDHLWGSHVRLNRDMLRTVRREDVLFHACLAVRAPMVVDNTNATRKARARYVAAANAAGYEVVAVWFRVPAEIALARNRGREGPAQVPDVAILGTLAKLEPPTLDEGFARIEVVEATDA